jgi:hypothetical protein
VSDAIYAVYFAAIGQALASCRCTTSSIPGLQLTTADKVLEFAISYRS